MSVWIKGRPGIFDVRSSIKSRPDGPEIQLPLYPSKRTQSGHRTMSVSCQQPTLKNEGRQNGGSLTVLRLTREWMKPEARWLTS
jgi:hypothetical protein